MDHPLIHKDNFELRRRVIQLLQSSYSVGSAGNIVFVCGGNCDFHMRPRFREYCKNNHKELEIFFPEFAMTSYFSNPDPTRFDIADFEKLIGDLSHVIVIFPEAPGSFAEAGYFSMVRDLASKTILALDSKWQGHDSFISMGPATKVGKVSIFSDVMQISYADPTFCHIVNRIKRVGFPTNRKALNIESFGRLSNYEIFCLLHECVNLLRVATIDDILFLLRGMFKNRISRGTVLKLMSILVGSGYLQKVPTSDYGHYRTNDAKENLMKVREGHAKQRSQVLLDLMSMHGSASEEFLQIQTVEAHAP